LNSSTIKAGFGAAFVGALATLRQAVAYGLIAISPLGAEWAVFGITASVGSAILFGMLSGGFSSNLFLFLALAPPLRSLSRPVSKPP
jgi:hypothetical protein